MRRNHFFERNQAKVEAAVAAAITDYAAQGAIIVEFRIPNLEYGLATIFAIDPASSTVYHDVSLHKGLTTHFEPDVVVVFVALRKVAGAARVLHRRQGSAGPSQASSPPLGGADRRKAGGVI